MAVIKDIKAFEKSLKVLFKRVTSKKQMKALAKFTIKMVVARTRRKFGVRRTGGPKVSLRSQHRHSPGYTKFRKANRTKLDRTTTPNTHNLTFSGGFLKSMTIKKLTKGQFVIGPNKRRRKGGITNERLSAVLFALGYKFNDLSKTEIDDLVKFYDKSISKEARKV